MSRELTPGTALESIRKDAKRWLKALRVENHDARARLQRAWPNAPAEPGLRDVQHAFALEHGFKSWAVLKQHLADAALRRGDSPRDLALRGLLEAADKGDRPRISDLLDTYPDIVNARGTLAGHTGFRTALHFGVRHEAVVRLLVERGADPNIRDEGDNATPLHFAAENGHVAIIRLLIEHGVDPIGEGDGHELGILGWATCFGKGDPEVVDYLLAHGARHNIFSAVAMGEVETIRSLARQSREDPDKPMDRTNQRRRPLHLAILKQQPLALAALLDLGADVEARDAAGLTPLDQAALSRETAMAQLLIDRGAAIGLPAAIGLQRGADIERLLGEEPDCLKPGRRWATLIVRAATSAPGHVIETLIRAGASVNVTEDRATSVDGARGYTPLHAAAFHGNAEGAAVLLEHGADPTVRDDKYCGTPAGWANYAGHDEVRDLILKGPIDIFDAIDRDVPHRILDILERDPGALERPFGEYARCESRPNQWWPEPGATPLGWAVATNKVDAARLLAERGAHAMPEGRAGGHGLTQLVASFLRKASLDWRVGGPERAMQTHAAGRILQRHTDIVGADIYTAVVCGEVDDVQRILSERPAAASEPGGPHGWPPLLYLCSARLPQGAGSESATAIARALLDRGADPNAYYPGGNPDIHYTALTCVVGRGEEQAAPHPQAEALVRLLLERGAEPYDQQVLYNVFAGHASERHLDEGVIWLLELIYTASVLRGRQADWADANWPMLDMGGYGCGARFLLDVAVRRNDRAIAEWLLAHGANPGAPPASDPRASRRSLYEDAVRLGFMQMADLLRRYGATERAARFDGVDAFTAACLGLDRATARALVAQHPEYLRVTDPMWIAARGDRSDIAALLLDLGMSPDIEHPQEGRARALHQAAYHDARDVATLLIERGAEVDPRETNHEATPMWWAFWGQKPGMVELLSRVSRDVWTLARAGYVDRLREVLEAEPRLAQSRGEHESPLFYLPDDEATAAEIARLLLANGADPTISRDNGTTAEQFARDRGLEEAADVLKMPL